MDDIDDMKSLGSFVHYVLSYYGPGGLYDRGATREEVVAAVKIRIRHVDHFHFEGDTTDRELVRDVLLAKRGTPMDQLEFGKTIAGWNLV